MAYVKTKLPCPFENCGSSDAYAIDDKGWGRCFSCDGKKKEGDDDYNEVIPKAKVSLSDVKQELANASTAAFMDRCLLRSTLERFGVGHNGRGLLFPYHDKDGDVVAIKRRPPGPSEGKAMPWAGSPSKALLFGQNLFPPASAKAITITEGEIDALSSYQMQGSKYPVVSIRSGAKSAAEECKQQWEYLDSFDKIVICFDADKSGKAAAKSVAELFVGKAVIVQLLDGLDANDYLTRNCEKEYMQAWWNAEPFKPDGIVNARDLIDRVTGPIRPPDVCLPWRGLNEKTYGGYFSQVWTLCAGSGVGKTQFCREIMAHFRKTTDVKQGAMFLEEGVDDTLRGQMSIEAGVNLARPKIHWNDEGGYDSIEEPADEETIKQAFEEVAGDGRLYLYDHFGSNNIDNIISRMRYMAVALGCRILWLDHISIVVSAGSNGDERKALDEIMTKLAILAQETNVLIMAVSHLKRPDGKGHEEGAATSLAQLRGSGAIGQLSHISIGLERNGQDEDEYVANTTFVRVLKNRKTGDLGLSCSLYYNSATSRLVPAVEHEEEAL
jgi:twinkle protein